MKSIDFYKNDFDFLNQCYLILSLQYFEMKNAVPCQCINVQTVLNTPVSSLSHHVWCWQVMMDLRDYVMMYSRFPRVIVSQCNQPLSARPHRVQCSSHHHLPQHNILGRPQKGQGLTTTTRLHQEQVKYFFYPCLWTAYIYGLD